MSQRLLVVTAKPDFHERIQTILDELEIADVSIYTTKNAGHGKKAFHIQVGEANRQTLLDKLHAALNRSSDWKITIYNVEACLPIPEEDTPEGSAMGRKGETREEIYNEVSKSARLDLDFMIFVLLSTVVAAIGLNDNNIAVVVGAMVIAPFLGPNLAFALGVALGDRNLMGRAMLTNVVGLAAAIGLSALVAVLAPIDLQSPELMARTSVGFDGIALALASGAAATLSLTTGISSALVGVMVAVALLPPAAAIGMMLGTGNLALAGGAAMLLAVNVVCLNLSAQLTFVLRGITPRTWYQKRNAKRASQINAAIWLGLLALLTGLILLNYTDLLAR